MTHEIIIEGDFRVIGLTQSGMDLGPLEYLKLRVGYPTPDVQVEEMRSKKSKEGGNK